MSTRDIFEKPLRQAAIIAVCSISLSLLLWHPSLEADWGPIDDHHMLDILGRDGKLPFSEIPEWFAKTTLGEPGKTLLFRPASDGGIILQCFLFGDNVRVWYSARIIGFAVMLGATWFVLARLAGFAMGSAMALFLSSLGFWGKIYAVLGTSELYASLGIALMALGMWMVIAGERRITAVAGWMLVLACSLVAITAKENYQFVAIPVVWLAWREKRMRRLGWGVALLAGATALLMGWAAAWAVAKAGHDLYYRQVNAGTIAASILRGLRLSPVMVTGAVLPVVAWGILRRWGGDWLRFARWWLFWEACLFALYVVQLVFNQDFWDRAGRYAFPGEVIAAFSWFVPLILLRRMGLGPGWIRGVAAGLLLAVVAVRGYQVPRTHARMNRDVTRAWSGKLNEAARAAHADPQLVVAISTRSIGTFEPMWSAKEYLRHRGRVDNPIVLRVDESRLEPWNWPAGMTPVMLEDIRRARRGELGFAPVSLIEGGRRCVEVSLTAEVLAPSPCEVLGTVAP